MKILFNATTLRKGGPLQRAVSFLQQMHEDALGHSWHVAVSDTIVSELHQLGIRGLPLADAFAQSPAQNWPSRRRLRLLQQSLCPDCVFTFAGPAYIQFDVPHLMGCTEPWVTHATWQSYRATVPLHRWLGKALRVAYKARWFRRADAWVVQTETARQGLGQRLGISTHRIAVVPNTCGSLYLNGQPVPPPQRPDGKWRFLCFAAPYPHKRLELIPYVARELKILEPAIRFEFVVTLPPDSSIYRRLAKLSRWLQVSDNIRNEGPIPIGQGPDLYANCDVCFLPTVLETFSATFPEAMAMNLPIVTTDLGFAREICRDAALYFEPNQPQSAARQLQKLTTDPVLRDKLIRSGKRLLGDLPTPGQQFRRYVQLLEDLVASRVQQPGVKG